MYQSSENGGGQLDARIHVFDGRLWVDRGGGGSRGNKDTTGLAENGEKDDEEEEEESDEEEETGRQVEEDERGGESRTATISQLLVERAQMGMHSGRYICSAIGSSGTWTLVHVLPGTWHLSNSFLFFFLLF